MQGLTLQIQGIRIKIRKLIPHYGSIKHFCLLRIGFVLQNLIYWIIKIVRKIKFLYFLIGKSKYQLMWALIVNFRYSWIHIAYFKGSILNTLLPVTANCQFAIKSS